MRSGSFGTAILNSCLIAYVPDSLACRDLWPLTVDFEGIMMGDYMN
jgi:hypothetical protein